MLNTETKEKLQNKFYPTVNQIVFDPMTKVLDQYLQPGVRVLDAGCGGGSWVLHNYRQKMGLLVGVDIEAPKEDDSRMDRFVLSELDDMPFPDATFDVVICYDVIEHLVHPQKVFAEFWRVLTDAGALIFKTPCVISLPFFISRYTSFSCHKKVKRILLGTPETHIFPTYYRCNTRRTLDRTLSAMGFRKEMLESVEEMYAYLVFNMVAYSAGLLISRLMQILPLTKPFRSQIIGAYCKPENGIRS